MTKANPDNFPLQRSIAYAEDTPGDFQPVQSVGGVLATSPRANVLTLDDSIYVLPPGGAFGFGPWVDVANNGLLTLAWFGTNLGVPNAVTLTQYQWQMASGPGGAGIVATTAAMAFSAPIPVGGSWYVDNMFGGFENVSDYVHQYIMGSIRFGVRTAALANTARIITMGMQD